MNFAVIVEGAEVVREFRAIGDRIPLTAAKAINKVARDQRNKAAKLIREEINIPASYLSSSGGRLEVAQKANRSLLEARIRARSRPTSLARYVTSGQFGKSGVTVKVKPGKAVFLRRPFLVKLPGVGGDTETQFNAGLAIRLRPGEKLSNKFKQVRLAKGLYLLYGPSIQQVFLNSAGKGVAADISQRTVDMLHDEFLRLMRL